MAKKDQGEMFVISEEYTVRIWRNKTDQYSVTVSSDEGGEREVVRKVVGDLSRAVEVATTFLNGVYNDAVQG